MHDDNEHLDNALETLEALERTVAISQRVLREDEQYELIRRIRKDIAKAKIAAKGW